VASVGWVSVAAQPASGALWLAGALCRGDVAELRPWVARPTGRSFLLAAALLGVGGAAFGAALGAWRSPLQAAYGAVKLPLLFALTAACTGGLNAMLAKLYGVPLTLGQSVLAVLSSFALAGVVLGSVAPPLALLACSLPASDSAGAGQAHRTVLLVSVGLVAWAGVAANLRLFALLKAFEVVPGQALKTLASWLGVNLFVGAQLSWNLRPFFGSPGLAEQLLRDDPFDGTFYECVYSSLRALLLGS